MKTKIRRFSKSVLSVILAMTLIMSTMLIGTISVNAAVSGNKMLKGDTLYFDLTDYTYTNGINYQNGSGLQWNNESFTTGRIVAATLANDITFSSSTELFKVQGTDSSSTWTVVKCTTLPSDGQNMIKVSSDGKSYTWGTYSSSTTYYYRGNDNNWSTTAMTKSDDGTYWYYETSRTGDHEFKLSKTTSSWDYDGNNNIDNSIISESDRINVDNSNGNCKIFYSGGTYYILLYPSDSTAKICASKSLPGSQPTTHTVSLDTYENGTVALVSASPAEVGSTFEFKVKANDNYAIDNVSLSDSTTVTAGDTDGDGYTHYTFTMPDTDVTINATFKSTVKKFALIGAYITDKDGNSVGTSGTFASSYTDSRAIKFDDSNQITIVVEDTTNARFQIIDDSNNIYKSTASRLQVAIDGSENSAKTSNSSTFAFQTSGAGTYTLTISGYTDGEVKFTASKEVVKYNVTAGTCTGGTFTVSPETAAEGETITVTPSPDTANNYVLDKVTYTPENGSATEVTATDGVYTFNMPASNVTVNVTFKQMFAVSLGTYENGTVALVSASPAEVGSTFEFKVKANDNYEIDAVSLSDSTSVTVGDTDSEGYTHYTFTMPATDVTINTTFKATVTPTKKFALIGASFSDTDGNSIGTSFATKYTDSNTLKFDDDNKITIVVEDTDNARFQIIDDSDNIYKSTESRLQVAIDGTENSAKTSNSSTFAFKTSGAGTYTLTITSYTDGEVKFTAVKETTVEKYTVTAGTCAGGTVTVGGSTSSVEVESGTQIPVIATAAENYEFVSWNAVDGVTFTDSTSAITTATITKNATITATFKSTSTEPDEKFYLEYWGGSNHQFIPYTSYADGVFTWETKFDFGSFSSDGKFRLTNTTSWTDGSESSFCVPAYKRSNQKGTETYVTVTASGASVETDSSKIDDGTGSYGVSKYNDIKLNGIDTSKTYIVTYTPGSSNSLDGQITIADKSVTPTLATPKIKGDSSALPESTITVALDNQKDFGTDEDGDKVYTANDDSLTFTYTVTASDGSKPVVTPTASGKIAKSDGTAINDSISFTASSDNGVIYTITCTVSSDGFDDVTSSELKVTVGTIPYAQADRIYAYAKTLGADETPALNAWVASESKVDAINTHNDGADGTPEGNKVEPTLGKTSDTNIRIFLPTTASSDKVVLYNSFSTSITVNGTEIQSGKYAEVSYTPNTEYTISNGKKLTIYKSTADGALYVNNTGDYASIDDNGALSMITKLYSDKEAGEIAAGNAGALADSNGVQDVAVKKIKGRGNSTWVSANKKSFNVTFTDNINAFGFTQGKKFSLLANFKDPSLSRNKILYELADLMGVKYSPDAATVDLYMNGLYMGSYLMCQKVDVGSKELVNDLGKTLLEDLYTDSVSGTVPESAADTIKSSGFSFLMELDSNATSGDFYTSVDDQKITIKEPEYLNDDGSIPTDAVTQAAITFVQNKYSALNTAMSNTNITLEELDKIIDVESLAKYFLINEIAKNYDIGVSSTYLVYNYTEGKFYISPLWDMDVTTGNCKATVTDYQSYEGNWTDNNSSYNRFMKKVMANPQVQSAARKLWTGSYYTTLTNYIDTLTTKSTSVEGSLNCNYTKWNYPYGFQGKYSDDVQALTSLKVATYNPSDNSYTVASSSTSYATTAVGQTQYVSDWLKSRVAWMSKKYNTYYLTGDFASSWGSAYTMANNSGVNTYAVENVSSGDHTFKICTDGGLSSNTENGTAYRDWSATSISYNADLNLVSDTSKITNLAVESSHNNITFTTSEAMTVYFTFNQKTNTLTLSDKETTSSNPTVTLSGSTVANEDIKDGTAVTLTATITPATSNNVVVTGDYTATLYIGDKVVTTKTVTFADDATEETTMNAVFSTYLEGTNQTYKVVVTCNDSEQDLTGTSNTVSYKQTGVKDQKIYFDPSPYITTDGAIWKNVTTQDSVVTVTLSDSTTFKMYIDSNDVHGLDKGVFRADIDEETLAKLQSSSTTITFSMDGTDLSCSVAGQSDIADGWIYNYSSQTSDGQMTWEQYNVAYEESYPGGCTTYAEFKAYLAAQVDKNTDNIVYFDNSASKFYNVYMYCWDSGTVGSDNVKNGLLMKKLPYADIWYYDFGSVTPSANFLFKDRSGPGFGTDYQQTVDLSGNTKDEDPDNDAYVYNGDGEKVYLNFAGTINTANPIFVTQNFYKCTVQNLSEDKKTDGLKFRAFNTQWDEFADVVASDVQTKAVDIYFDLHDNSATDIQLYHTSTNSKYTFASEFTRLTQMPGSTIYHSTIMLPYTDNGIAFKFDKFVVNYSGGKKTCAMSAKVQPTFTCINTGEVWYEINSDFANLGYDTAVSSASFLTASSPFLTASEVTPSIVYVPKDLTVGSNTVSGIYLWSDNSQYIGYPYDSTLSNLVDFPIVKIKNKEYYAVSYNITDGSSNFHFILRSLNYQTSECINYTVGNSYIVTNTSIENQGTATYRTTTETTVYVAGNFAEKNNDVNHFAVYSGSNSVDYDFAFTATEYTFNGYTVYKAVAIDVSTLKTYAHIDATDNEDSKRISNIINNDTVGNYDNKLYYYAGSDSSENRWITDPVWDATDEPTIKLSAASNNLTLVDGVATTTLTTTITNADGATVTYTVDPSSGASVSDDGTTFTATTAGTYTVTASITVNGTTYPNYVTIKVAEEVTEDYCGVLAYNHSTATFDVTGGGTINKTDVVLTNGYYKNTAGDNTVTTGYTSYDGTTYTVIYALPSTGKTDASTSYSSTTSHTDSNYKFNDWTKNGIVKSTETALADEISGTSTVAYVANWSLVQKVSYTFTYKYYEFDTSKGMAYAEGRDTILNDGYVIQVTLPENSSVADIQKAYLANAPKLESDYFIYSFDGVTITVDGLTASATANNDTIRYYTVRFDNGDTITVNNYYYQHVAELTYDGTVPSGKYVAWMNENNEVLHYGTTYNFRVTRNIDIHFEFVDSDSVSPATYVNEPTYEFYINDSGKEYVRFNILVENLLADLSIDNVEFGTLYFFTDSTGKPNDSTISVEADLDPNTLITVSDGNLNVKSGVGQHNVNTVSSEYKYIYAPKMPNTSANVDRYVRVYSYIAVKDDNGNYTDVIVSNSYALASIRDALNKS
ncbi:CotH kinase family protein [Ruminococcus sp.]|uniref:CotH kinase family protein n=1 Tax=Ruminococcus sp. TaxID=41978 RepID=UPI003F017636